MVQNREPQNIPSNLPKQPKHNLGKGQYLIDYLGETIITVYKSEIRYPIYKNQLKMDKILKSKIQNYETTKIKWN